MKVKICGITNERDARAAASEGADALGFIFVEKSPRYISPDDAASVIRQIGPYVTTVGVFGDHPAEQVRVIAGRTGVSVLQFHGSESADFCRGFSPRWKVVKTVFPHQRPYRPAVAGYSADAYLCDVLFEQKTRGVSRLAPDALEEIKELIRDGVRIVISGGITPANVEEILPLRPYGIDVCSGVEHGPGQKDPDKMKCLLSKARQ
ncbi:MAG: N-(5'-phosphoribosyl)anthranilate isomerase [Candidatus Omnitrophica bacterium]|nr:N-(5'-phosphoribosyl)anthranilate isomerase [Candidatus Omnitrophota bacterium]